MLQSFTEELSLNFLERRGKQNNHKSTILEELQDVITVLTQRESDLLTAVQVALSLLEENDNLQIKRSKNKMKLLKANDKIQHLTIEIKTLEDSLIKSEDRYELMNRTLIETEELMLENSAELNRMVRERFREVNPKELDEDFEAVRKDYKDQLENMQKKRWELEREKTNLACKLSSTEQEYSSCKEKCLKLDLKIEKLQRALKESENLKDSLKIESEKLEIQFKALNSNYLRLKVHCERLEEDLNLAYLKESENSTKKIEPGRLSYQTEGLSLEDEICEYFGDSNLDYCSEDENLSVSSTKLGKGLCRAASFSYMRLLSTDKCKDIMVSPQKVQRKGPPEEYFALSVQAVKMNSPHMDNIIHASASELYEKAIKKGIPFHKWHVWIESQLNSIYVQTIYKKSSKTVWKRYTQKMCLAST